MRAYPYLISTLPIPLIVDKNDVLVTLPDVESVTDLSTTDAVMTL